MTEALHSSIRRRAFCQETVRSDAFSNVHPVIARVLVARGITHPAQAQPRLGELMSPQTLGGMQTACDMLLQAIEQQRPITILGDFDADGATGTAVAVRGLHLLGAADVRYCVPDRMRHGYGISVELIEELAPSGADFLISVDTGIACVAGVTQARERGADIIITDHHLPGEVLPPAHAIVNPNIDGDPFPSKSLSGCGVMFYLLMALRAHMRDTGMFEQQREPDLRTLLDLVAIGTVADMVKLDQNNRTLVHAGLRRMRRGQCQPGIAAIAHVAGRVLKDIQTSDIGFAIAPRINAAGRLDDMRTGIACLLTDDADEAMRLANELDAINQARRDLQKTMVKQAETMALPDDLPQGNAIVVHNDEWHPGIVGLVASRLKDRAYRPVVAFSAPDEDGLLRGSARSIKGFHIRDALADIQTKHPDLMEKFGGHAMAAGLSLPEQHLETFTQAFHEVAQSRLEAEQLERLFYTDGTLAASDCTQQLAKNLAHAAPWGQGFPEPCFDGMFEIKDAKVLGTQGDHLKLSVVPVVDAHDASTTKANSQQSTSRAFDAIAFGFGHLFDELSIGDQVTLVYQLNINRFRGRENLQLMCQAVMV